MKYRLNVVVEFEHDDALPGIHVNGPLSRVAETIENAVQNIMENHNPPDEEAVHLDVKFDCIG